MHSNAIQTVSTQLDSSLADNTRVDWTEVSFHSPYFFFKNFVPEPRLEFALSQRCGRDTHGFLPTTKQDL